MRPGLSLFAYSVVLMLSTIGTTYPQVIDDSRKVDLSSQPHRHQLPDDVTKWIVEIDLLNASNLAAGLNNAKYALRAIPTAKLATQVSKAYQGDNWWQTIDAQRNVTDLERIAQLSLNDRADLRAAVELDTERKYLVEQQKFEDAIDVSRKQYSILQRVLGSFHPRVAESLMKWGEVYERYKHYEDARKKFSEALTINEHSLSQYHPRYVKNLQQLASASLKANQSAEAQVLLRRAAAISRFNLEDPILENDSLNELLESYLLDHKYVDAIEILKRQLVLLERPGWDRALIAATRKLAEVYGITGNHEQADALLLQLRKDSNLDGSTNRSITDPQPHNWAPLPTPSLDTAILAEVARREDDVNQAINGPTAKNIFPAIKDAEYVLGVRRMQQGDSWWQTIDIKLKLADLRHIAELRPEQRALLKNSYDDFTRADDPEDPDKTFYEQSKVCDLKRQLLGDRSPMYASCVLDLVEPGFFDRTQNAAERAIRSAVQLLSESVGPNHPLYAQSLRSLARITKDGDETKRLYFEYLEILKNVNGFTDEYISALRDVGGYCKREGEYASAEGMFLEALRLNDLPSDQIYRRSSWSNSDFEENLSEDLARVYIHQRKYKQAETLYRRALDISGKKDKDNRSDQCLNAALADLIVRDSSRRDEAADFFLESVRAWWTHSTSRFPALSKEDKESLAKATCGRAPASEKLYSLVFSDTNIKAESGFQAALYTKHFYYDSIRQESEAVLAIAATGSREWRASWEHLRELRDKYVSTNLKVFQQEHPRQYLFENPQISEELLSLRLKMASLDEQMRADTQYNKVTRFRDLSVSDVLSSLQPRQAVVEYVRFKPYDFDKHRSTEKIHYGAFIVKYGTSKVLAVDLGEAEDVDSLIEQLKGRRSVIDKFISSVDVGLDFGSIQRSEQDIAEMSCKVQERIWGPIAPLISDTVRIYLGTEGALDLVPFEIFARRTAGGDLRYLVEDKELVYIGTARNLVLLSLTSSRLSSAPKTAVVVGNPAFNAKTVDLAEIISRLTSRDVAQMWNQNVSQKLGAESDDEGLPREWDEDSGSALATFVDETTVKLKSLGWNVTTLTGKTAVGEAVESLKSPTILQIATHGYFFKPGVALAGRRGDLLLRSMLVFAGANTWRPTTSRFYKVGGHFVSEQEAREKKSTAVDVGAGFLTAYQVAGMDLHSTQLVNLTACDTGVGEITADGVSGFRQAFRMAGARSVTMSLWPIPADQILREMADFYEHWLPVTQTKPQGDTVAYQAFRAAQLDALTRTRKILKSGHPFYWAGIIFSGDPGDLPSQTPTLRSFSVQ